MNIPCGRKSHSWYTAPDLLLSSLNSLPDREWSQHTQALRYPNSNHHLTATAWQPPRENFPTEPRTRRGYKIAIDLSYSCFEGIWYTAIDNEYRAAHTIVACHIWSHTAGAKLLLLLASRITDRNSSLEDTIPQKARENNFSLHYTWTRLPHNKIASNVINPSYHSSSHFPRTYACHQDGWVGTGSGIHCQNDFINQSHNRKYMVLSN